MAGPGNVRTGTSVVRHRAPNKVKKTFQFSELPLLPSSNGDVFGERPGQGAQRRVEGHGVPLPGEPEVRKGTQGPGRIVGSAGPVDAAIRRQ